MNEDSIGLTLNGSVQRGIVMSGERLAAEMARLETSTTHLRLLAADDPALTDAVLRLAATIDSEAKRLGVLIQNIVEQHNLGRAVD